jgi:hypothetical protein
VSDAPWTGEPSLPVDKMKYIELKCSKFLSQPRIFFDGTVIKTEAIIKHVANRLGGVHFQAQRKHNHTEELIDEASRYYVMGNPNHEKERRLIETDNPKRIHLVLPRERGHLWTGLDVEMMAAALSFLNIRINGEPFVIFGPGEPRL